MFVVRCVMFVVCACSCCWLLVVGCLLLVVACWLALLLFIGSCLSGLCVVSVVARACCLVCVVCCVCAVVVVGCWLFVVGCWLLYLFIGVCVLLLFVR